MNNRGGYVAWPLPDEPQVIKATPAAAQKCQPRMRLKTEQEAGVLPGAHFVLKHYGGQNVRLVGQGWAWDEDVVEFSDGFQATVSAFWLIGIGKGHEWIDTGGMLRSYCKHCDAVGEWDRATCQYVAKA
jgi:hypothetical protein